MMILSNEAGPQVAELAQDITQNLNVFSKFMSELPEKALSLGVRLALTLLFLFVGLQIIKIIRKILKKSLMRANADTGVIQFMDSFTKMGLYIVLGLTIASKFGMDAASIVALLGSAGVAIGLALQGSLANFAGGVLILLLKPFKVGDYIIEDSKGNQGTVTEIQLFYTKLTTVDGKVIVLPNGALANTSLTNVSAAEKRRVDLQVGISYNADMKLAKSSMEQVLKEEKATLQNEEIFCFVDSLGDSEVFIGGRCYVKPDDYFTAKCRMTERLKELFDEKGIEIPFKQLDVHIEQK